MTDLRDRAAVYQILQESMSVRRHCNQIAIFLARDFENSSRGITQLELRLYLKTMGSQISCHHFEIGSIRFHLFGISQLKPIVISRRPTISHVEEKQHRAMEFCQLRDMRKHRPIGRAIVERDEDFLVHRQSCKSQRLSYVDRNSLAALST
jgi:hypothetical protein